MTKIAYTVFREDDGHICHFCEDARSPEEVLKKATAFYSDGWAGEVKLIAWAAEPVLTRGGRLECDDLCAESIAAGRVVERVAGQWVPRGVPVEDKPAKSDEPEWVMAARSRVAQKRAADPTYERIRPALTWADSKPFDAFGGFFTEPADMADWQDTYYPR